MIKQLLGLLVLVACLGLADQTFGQTHHQGVFARGSQVLFGKRHHDPRVHSQQAWRNRWFHNQELPPLRPDDGWGRYPKYYGGFHSSHFDRIGVPHGDIGFRGPSIFWTPW